MAVIEIQAATLPGFPYYFPYRTGVRLTNAPTTDGSKVYFGDTDVTLTAEATVTSLRDARVDADLGVSGTTEPDTLRDAAVESDQTILAFTVLDFLRNSPFDTDLTVSALGEVIGSRGQSLDGLVELTTWFDTLAQINAAPATIDPAIEVTVTAEIQLNAAGDTALGIVSATTVDQYLDAVAGSNTMISTGFNFDGETYTGFETDTTNITITFTADALRDARVDSAVEATAALTAESSQGQFLDVTIGLTAIVDARVTNGDAALTVAAEPVAAIMLTQYLDTDVTVTGDALVDTLDTRYGDASVTLTAEIDAGATLAAVTDSDLAVTTALEADLHRTVYAEAEQSVLAGVGIDISRDQLLQAELALQAALDSFLQGDLTGNSSLEMTAAALVAVLRETYATAQTDVTADRPTVAHRTVYAASTLDLTAEIPFPLANLLGVLDPIPYPILTELDAFQQGDMVAHSHLDLLGSSYPMPNALFLLAAALQAVVDPHGVSNLHARINATLDTTAIIGLLDIHRYVWAVAEETQILAALADYTMYFIWLVQAQTEVLATNPAAMLYRHAGGNPMWLMYFYYGEGRRYPVAGSGSPG